MSFFDGLGQALSNGFSNPNFADSLTQAHAFLNGDYGTAIGLAGRMHRRRHHPSPGGVPQPGQMVPYAGGAQAYGAGGGVDPTALPFGAFNAPMIGQPAVATGVLTDDYVTGMDQASGYGPYDGYGSDYDDGTDGGLGDF